MKEVVIVSAARTPIGSFGGSLKDIPAAKLGAIAAESVISRAGINKDEIGEVIFGNVLSAGLGQNVSRQIALGAGLPDKTPATTVNNVCGSGLKSVSMAAQAIKAGDADIVLAGGAENMSLAPYLLPSLRFGNKMGDTTVIDTMIKDGLWDAFNDYHMGITAENIAEKFEVSRQAQDEFALASQQKAETAIKAGKFSEEIEAVMIPQRRGEPIAFDTDEYPRFGSTIEGFAKLKPAFKKDGTVTAGNASGINDGAAAVLVASKQKADELKLPVMAKILSYASAGVDPKIMGMGVVPAVKLALEKADMTVAELDLIEANEAFAAQALAVSKELDFDMEKVNVNGGAIALGHPIGASGARILVSLLYEMKRRSARYGLATLCVGGGMGVAVIVEMQEGSVR